MVTPCARLCDVIKAERTAVDELDPPKKKTTDLKWELVRDKASSTVEEKMAAASSSDPLSLFPGRVVR